MKCSLIGKAIAKRRTQAVTEKYMEIGGKSPILDWTKKQGQLLCQKLNNSCRNFGPFKSYVAFRYVNPLTEDCFKEIEKYLSKKKNSEFYLDKHIIFKMYFSFTK